MFPVCVAKQHEVLVLKTVRPDALKKERIVYNDHSLYIVNIFSKDPRQRIFKAYRSLNKFKPDIVHLFQSVRCHTDARHLRYLTPNAKWILDFRSPLFATKGSSEQFKRLKNFFLSQFHVDWIMTHSKLTLASNLPIRIKKSTEIPPGVDLKIFKPRVHKESMPVKFVFIGSLAKIRKVDLLINMFQKAMNSLKVSIKLDIYGKGNALEDITMLIKNKSLQNSICLKGVLPQKELFVKLGEYDVGIAYVPNEGEGRLFSKAPSLKSLEYAAAGLHVIASATQGHKDYMNRFGFEFELFKNSCEDFQAIIKKILTTGFSSKMIEKNQQALENFDWYKIVEKKLIPLYRRLADKKINLLLK